VTDPVVAGERLYVGAADTIHALDARTGDDIGETVVAVDDLVYTTAWGTVRAFRPP